MPPPEDPFPGFPVDPDVTSDADVPPPRIHATVVSVIAAGGALGALARWAVAEALPHASDRFPWETLLTNVAGCFLIGVLMVLVVGALARRRLVRPFFGTGILGGFTTFSTYSVDTRALFAAGRPGVALAYLAGTLALGLVAVVAGLRGHRAGGTPMTVLLVLLGGAVGAPLRYLTDVTVHRRHGTAFPWGTWTVNVVGSFVLGVVVAAGPAWVVTLAGTGFCGRSDHLLDVRLRERPARRGG